MRKKLLIKRKAYKRKAFIRCRKRKCAKVSATTVPATQYLAKDLGAVGRGRKLIRITRKGALTRLGYHSASPSSVRRKALRSAVSEYGADRVWRMLNAQVRFRQMKADGMCDGKCNVCRPDVREACGAFLSDRDWIKENYRISAPIKAIKAWQAMSPALRSRKMRIAKGLT
jgi:hypothetical protein